MTSSGELKAQLSLIGGPEESWPQGEGPGGKGSNNRGPLFRTSHLSQVDRAAVRLGKMELHPEIHISVEGSPRLSMLKESSEKENV